MNRFSERQITSANSGTYLRGHAARDHPIHNICDDVHQTSGLLRKGNTYHCQDVAYASQALEAVADLDQHEVARVRGQVVALHDQHARGAHGGEVAAVGLQTEAQRGAGGLHAGAVLAAAPAPGVVALCGKE